MGFFKALEKLMYNIGKVGDEWDKKHSYYDNGFEKPYSGEWVNKGTDLDENWVWEEKAENLRPYYLNVTHIGDDYIISMDLSPKDNAIETVKCEDTRDGEIGTNLLNRYYRHFGNVVIRNSIEETKNDDAF